MTLDFSNQIDFLWALLPETLLSFCAMAILVAGVRGESQDGRRASWGWIALLGVLLAGGANGWLYGVHEMGDTSMVALDHFRLFANWVLLAAAGLAILISFDYVEKQRLQGPEFYGLILLSTVGMMFMVSSRDLILTFLGLEVMSIAVYVLAAFNRRDRKSAESGLKYFLLGAFASGFFLYGIALVYGATGSTNVALIGTVVESGMARPGLLTTGVLMLVVGFGFKVSLVPFHMWTPDVYEGAPTPVTAFMSVGVKAAGFVAFLRVFLAFAAIHEIWGPVLWMLAAVTMVGANVMALAQANVKRMLAYSSIAHAGYLLIAIVALNGTAAAGMLFYLMVYAVMNVGAFGVLVAVAHHGEERQHVEDFSGLGVQQPFLAVLLTLFLLSLAGFPGTGGFMGKIYLLLGAGEAGLWSLAVILVLTTLASYWYYLRVAWYMWMRDPRASDAHTAVVAPMPMRFALVAAAAIILLTGVLPAVGLEFARDGVEGLAGFMTGTGR